MTAKKNIPRLGEGERSETFPSLAEALMSKMAQKIPLHLIWLEPFVQVYVKV